jgi:putative membrane protein
MKLILRFLLLCASIFLLSKYLNGFSITGPNTWQTIGIVSICLFLLHLIVKPIVAFVTLPINVLTLGIFSLVINGLFVWIVAWKVENFSIASFGTAVIAAVVISIINAVFAPQS